MQYDITYQGIPFEVEVEIQRAESSTLEYPGCDERIDIVSIYHNGTDFTDFFFQYGSDRSIRRTISEMEKLVSDQIIDEYYT